MTNGAPPPPSQPHPPPAAGLALLNALRPDNRHAFLQPRKDIPTAALQVAKDALDGLAGRVGEAQEERIRRSREGKGKRRRQVADSNGNGEAPLKIRRMHLEGFETALVWRQARRIIGCALEVSREVLGELEGVEGLEMVEDVDEDAKMLEFEDGFEVGSSSSESDDDNASSDSQGSDSEGGDSEIGQEDEELREDLDGQDGDDFDDDDDLNPPAGEFVEDPNGLNDGFFSIDDFNKQTQLFEEQDARGDPNTDQVSDEEVDWHTDPFAAPQGKATKPRRGKQKKDTEEPDFGLEDDLPDDGDDGEDGEDGEDDEDDEDDAGPTFGPEVASDDDLDQGLDGGLENGLDLTANDIFYKDFFAPPPKKAKKGSKPKPPRPEHPSQPDDRDIERAISDVRRDLFDDFPEHSDSDDALSDVSAGDPKSRRSAHERRQAKLAEEIRKLEAESVAKRAWTLSGEASAADRPVNSLLEADLDFEHVGKPVPVITEEVSESIEALIKRRILAQEFDEVIRRRPDAASFGGAAPARRGLVELDDSKPKQSLAELYEEEHVKAANPDAYVSAADEKLRREEREVAAMWKDVSSRLDALCSWHYRPRPAEPTIAVVTDVPTVAMEDAQPATAQGVGGGASMVAPQEVYRAGGHGAVEKGEVVGKSGLPVARQEMSREEKGRRRRREKERIRKSGGGEKGRGKDGDGKKKEGLSKTAVEQKQTLADLKKGGVKVINRKGEVVGLDGKKAKAPVMASSGSFKL